MSILEDVNKLHLSIRYLIFSQILIMPFWYLSIYLFSNMDFNSNIQIPIVSSFCLSLTYYILNIFSAGISLESINLRNHQQIEKEAAFLDPIFNSIIYLSIFMFVGYWFGFHFRTFVLFTYSFSFLGIITKLFINLFKRKTINPEEIPKNN